MITNIWESTCKNKPEWVRMVQKELEENIYDEKHYKYTLIEDYYYPDFESVEERRMGKYASIRQRVVSPPVKLNTLTPNGNTLKIWNEQKK